MSKNKPVSHTGELNQFNILSALNIIQSVASCFMQFRAFCLPQCPEVFCVAPPGWVSVRSHESLQLMSISWSPGPHVPASHRYTLSQNLPSGACSHGGDCNECSEHLGLCQKHLEQEDSHQILLEMSAGLGRDRGSQPGVGNAAAH